jgi:hypothetical protein
MGNAEHEAIGTQQAERGESVFAHRNRYPTRGTNLQFFEQVLARATAKSSGETQVGKPGPLALDRVCPENRTGQIKRPHKLAKFLVVQMIVPYFVMPE